jgi:Ca2+/Na+ antiporter
MAEQGIRAVPVSETSIDALRRVLGFAAVVELGTGLVLVVDPAIVVTLLLGAEVSGTGTLLGRCFGIALLALGLACWPSRQRAGSGSPAFRAMSTYNALIALYLAYLGTVGRVGGLLLWPAVALHAVVALLLVWTWRGQRRTQATDA